MPRTSSLILLLSLLLCACSAELVSHRTTDQQPPDNITSPNPTPTPDPNPDPTPSPPAPPPQAPPEPAAKLPPHVPAATQPCPEIVEGDVVFLGATVKVWVDSTVEADGPLVFYWHGTGSSPIEPLVGLGLSAIAEIKARGGMVVAPRGPTGRPGSQTGGVVWTSGDLELADEIVACAVQQVGIDTSRIHSMGLSAGALHTTIMSYSRSGYLASVVSNSGGLVPILPPPPSQYPTNKLAAMIVHGGDNDQLGWFSFKEASERYRDAMRDAGHFTLLCDHGQGHTIPPNASGAWRFLLDHPWGKPSPYMQNGPPPGMPGTCVK